MSNFSREVETRLATGKRGKRLDTFTDDFSPPGTAESSPGANRTKPGTSGGYQKPHDDSPATAEPGFVRAAAAGNAKDQEPLDEIDAQTQRQEGGIKKPSAQFPGTINEHIERRLKALEKKRSK